MPGVRSTIWRRAAALVAATALAGQFRVLAFAASFVPITVYVVTFLVTFRRVKG